MDPADIITIDGPSGSGKSTMSRLLAARMSYAYLDTGAMYRAVGLKTLKEGLDPDDEDGLTKLLANLDLKILPGEDDSKVILDQQDVSLEIRTPEIGMMASKVSAKQVVRQQLTELQRRLAEKGRVVVEGRDMGTVVFPHARNKFYLDAKPEERARRRTHQLHKKGMDAEFNEILTQIQKRDDDDSHRSLAPLKPASDAVIIDSSEMTINQVVDFMVEKIDNRLV